MPWIKPPCTQISIQGCPQEPEGLLSFPCREMSLSPEGNYAILHSSDDRFLAVVWKGDPSQGAEPPVYVDMVHLTLADDCFGVMYSPDWSTICYGYARIRSFTMDTGRTRTECRFYFDIPLYKQQYEAKNGVPYTGEKRFRNTTVREDLK